MSVPKVGEEVCTDEVKSERKLCRAEREKRNLRKIQYLGRRRSCDGGMKRFFKEIVLIVLKAYHRFVVHCFEGNCIEEETTLCSYELDDNDSKTWVCNWWL